MQVEVLTKYLTENPEQIVKILEACDFHSVSFFDNKQEIRCAYYAGGNPTSVYVNCETLYTYIFSRGIGGDLFYVIGLKNNWGYYQTISYIQQILGIDNLNNLKSPYIFNGFYKHLHSNNINNNEILPMSMLDTFVNHPNIRFLKDNISLETQYKFNIRYDTISSRIIVPWFNQKGELVGITGRYNFDELGNFPKWKAIVNFSKGNFLYGIFENFHNIKNSGYVIIGESEKFVLQLDSMGYNNALALGNCVITDKQARLIKSLPVKKIILALDEGIGAEHLLSQCEKLKGGIFSSGKEIWCIYDSEHKILKEGSKLAPSDLGKENFELLLNKFCFRKD